RPSSIWRTSATSARYPAMASSTRSSVWRPLVDANSCRRVSVSGLKCTSMPSVYESCPPLSNPSLVIQDEPGGGAGFSYKMSLEERSRMLGFDHQRADIGTIEPGADSGVFGRQ